MKTIVTLAVMAVMVFGLEVGQMAPSVVIEGNAGGLVDGRPFSTDALRGKTTLLIYADPDKKDLNKAFLDQVKAKKFPRDRYQSVAVVNMAATWKPNFIIAAILKKKQKEYPDTIYVKDKKKVLLRAWQLADDDFNIVILSPDNEVLFVASGQLDPKKQRQALQLLQRSIYDDHGAPRR